MTAAPAHWDEEIGRIAQYLPHYVTAHKATATVGVAVDDGQKRDYFAERLQKLLDEHAWAQHLTIKIVPMNGERIVLLKATPR